ncbi:MAG: hypothetical protein Q8S33_37630 [Myxococcales bacterium]|nr:hypothetical protein [Myxococcales bacterium]
MAINSVGGFRGNRAVEDIDIAEARATPAPPVQLPAQNAGHSEFQPAPAATPVAAPVAAPPAPPEAVAMRTPEVTSLTGSPATQKSADVVRPETQVATIAQAAKPEERAAVIAHFEKAGVEERKRAFEAVLSASTTQGTHPVALGPFTGSVTVDGKGDVNGKPLASDLEVQAASQLANLSNDDRKAQLKQVGVSDRWLGVANEQQVLTAFNKVEMQRRFGEPGATSVDLPTLRQPMGRGTLTIPGGPVPFSVTADRQLTTAAGGTAPATSVAALDRIIEAETKAWPAGPPEARLKTRIEDTQLKVTDSDKLATITSVLSQADAARFTGLIDTPPGVKPGSIDAVYHSVLDARRTPGSKSVDLSLTPLLESRGYSLDGETVMVEQPPVFFKASMEVSADGKVNGKMLGVDELAKLSSQLATVPAEAKEAALKEAGLPEAWMSQASPEQKDTALAKLRQATLTPGEKTLDLSFDVTFFDGSPDGGGEKTGKVDGAVTLSVGADGKVGGRTPAIEVALATSLTMERMPMVEKRLMLGQLGIPADAVRKTSAEEASDLLTRVALRTKTPGEQQLEAKLGGTDYVVGLRISAKGDIEAAGAQVKPPPPRKQKWYKKLLGPILTVASFVFPVAAPALQAINAAVAIKNGAKGLGLVAAVAGAVSGVGNVVANLTGAGSSIASAASTVASVAGRVANLAGAANGVRQGVKTGDFLGAFSSVVSLAGQVGSLTNTNLGSNFDLLQRAGTAASYASRALNGDVAGLAGEALGAGLKTIIDNASAGTAPTATQADVRRVDNAIDVANAETRPSTTDFSLGAGARPGQSGESTVRLGTGDDGASLGPTPATGSTQADVRRVDNQLFGAVLRVNAGDTLTRIAGAALGDPGMAPEVYAWNAAKIGANPNQLRAGMDLEMPPAGFRLSDAERSTFYASTHLAPPSSGNAFSDNRDARDLGAGGRPATSNPSPATSGTPPPATTSPAQPRVGGTGPALGPNTTSAEWGGFDPSVGTASGTETLRPGAAPPFLMASKLKFELTAGTFKGEIAISPEATVTFKKSNDELWTKDVQFRLGAVKFTAEPSVTVDIRGNFKVEGKVQGQAGPVAVAIKGSIAPDGTYRLDLPTVAYKTDWLGAGFKVFGMGVQLTWETGPLARSTDNVLRPVGGRPSSSNTDGLAEVVNGYVAP